MTHAGHVFTPPNTAAAEERIRNLAAIEYTDDPLEIPITIMLLFAFEIPKSWTKAKKEVARQGFVPHTSTPDLDNLVKLVTDALNGVVYKDDRQIVRIDAVKLYMPASQTLVMAHQYE